MPGPPRKDVKHGRTPTTGANDWIDVDDVPFEGAPPLPRLGPSERSRQKWHPWTLEWYAEVSAMPHCVRWKQTDWRTLFDLARMKDQWYKDGDEAKTSLAAEIRHRENALGLTEASRKAMKIRYVPVRASDEPDLRHEGTRAHEQATAASDPAKAGKVLSMAERRAAIVKTA
jgi:hypothetical protein